MRSPLVYFQVRSIGSMGRLVFLHVWICLQVPSPNCEGIAKMKGGGTEFISDMLNLLLISTK